MLHFREFLKLVVDDALEVVEKDWPNEPKNVLGAKAGLEACRDKSPPQLFELLERAKRVRNACFHRTDPARYWKVTCYYHEVEWVCSVVSVVMVNEGYAPLTDMNPAAMHVASRIVQTEVSKTATVTDVITN